MGTYYAATRDDITHPGIPRSACSNWQPSFIGELLARKLLRDYIETVKGNLMKALLLRWEWLWLPFGVCLCWCWC